MDVYIYIYIRKFLWNFFLHISMKQKLNSACEGKKLSKILSSTTYLKIIRIDEDFSILNNYRFFLFL